MYLSQIVQFFKTINKDYEYAELREGAIHIKPEILSIVRKKRAEKAAKRSTRVRCSFLADTKDMGEFLDEPVDFENPLRDAFDFYTRLLAS